MAERKPTWLKYLAPDGNRQHLTPVRCACGLWVIEDRERTQWDKWDAGVITGDDLTVAIILKRRLTRIERTPAGAILSTVWGELGIEPDGEYLSMHLCGQPRITIRPYEAWTRTVGRQDLSWLPSSTLIEGADPWASRLDTMQETLPI